MAIKHRLSFFLFACLFLSVNANAAYQSCGTNCFEADSCSSTDVQSAMTAATDQGSEVRIPTCTATNWSSSVSWSAPDNAILSGGGSTSVLGGNDQTIIVDQLSGSGPVITISVSAGEVFTMRGITIRSGSGGVKDSGGMLRINGPTGTPGTNPAEARIHNCHFDSITNSRGQDHMLQIWGNIVGVMDNCILDFQTFSGFYPHNGGDTLGNNSWATTTNLGSKYFFFLEDNRINGLSTAAGTRAYDLYSGGRVVLRFNDLYYASCAEVHGTGHATNDRGGRAQEIYGNKSQAQVSGTPGYTFIDASAGVSIIWGNDSGSDFQSYVMMDIERKNNDSYSQQPTPTGWGYCGTDFNGTGSNWDGGTYNSTDTTYGYPCLDQVGRGGGALLTGDHPNKINSETETIAWPDQPLEPAYFFANEGSYVSGWGGSAYFNVQPGGDRLLANRDYYRQNDGQTAQVSSSSPFDGTSGTGWGTLANRPTTCTTGVAYFATDQGSWNTSNSNPYGVQQSGSDGILYQCTSTDTWEVYYTPYIYPHPLRAEAATITGVTIN